MEVNAVFGWLWLGRLVEVPGWLLPRTVGCADGGKQVAAALVERASEHRRPEGRHLQHVVPVEGDVADPGCHGLLLGAWRGSSHWRQLPASGTRRVSLTLQTAGGWSGWHPGAGSDMRGQQPGPRLVGPARLPHGRDDPAQ